MQTTEKKSVSVSLQRYTCTVRNASQVTCPVTLYGVPLSVNICQFAAVHSQLSLVQLFPNRTRIHVITLYKATYPGVGTILMC